MSKFALLIFGGMMPGGPGSLRGSHFRCNRHHHHRGHHKNDHDSDCHHRHHDNCHHDDKKEDDYDYVDNHDETSLTMTI